jgi:hypothetical protein
MIPVMNEIKGESDRVSCIVVCALLDDKIKASLTRRLWHDEEAIEHFFDPQRSTAGFVNLIKLAYLLGIYQKETRRNLLAMARIRNLFAHDIRISRFDDELLDDDFNNITLYKLGSIPSYFTMHNIPKKPKSGEWSRRDKFLYSAYTIYGYCVYDYQFPVPTVVPGPF